MKCLNTYVLTIVATFSSILWAGPSVGGGGDVIILPDDSVVLADPFIDGGAPQPNNMPPLRALNPRILQVINLYGKVSAPIISELAGKTSDINAVLANLAIRKNDLRFYGVQTVEELNQFCAPGGRKIYKLPNGAQVQQVACTAGNETFMVEPLFTRLSLRDQGLLLIHERLTTLRDQYGGKNYSAIGRFTTGLNVYLSLYSEQNKKKYRTLTLDEQKVLTDFYVATEEIEKRNSDVTEESFQWLAQRTGGGRVHVAAMSDDSALVSLNSVIVKGSELGANSKVINFSNPERLPIVVENGASLENIDWSFPNRWTRPTGRSKIVLRSNAAVSNLVLIDNATEVSFGEHSVVSNLNISGAVSIGDEAKISNSKISLTKTTGKIVLGERLTLSTSELSAPDLVIGNDFTLIDGNLTLLESSTFGYNVKIKKTNIEGSRFVFEDNISFENMLLSKKVLMNVGSNTTLKNSKLLCFNISLGANTKIEDSSLQLNSSNESNKKQVFF